MRRPIQFGKYVLLDRISVGGMAEVFLAKAFGVRGFEKIVAIKRILPSMAADRDFIDMFIDEAKIAGQLSHTNVAQIYELGRIDKSHFIVMEYVWGKDALHIHNRFRKLRRRMPLQMACYVAAQACEALDYAHSKRDQQGQPMGIIHRDISPQNILVSYDGEVKLIDFGIAKAVSRSSRTQAGVLKGKFGYMSPEQVRGLPLDCRSDLFAVGTVLYELCVGERLFVGESDFAVLEKVRNADVVRPSVKNPMLDEALESIIMKALSREPDDRYMTAGEMHEALNGYLMRGPESFSAPQLAQTLRDIFAVEYAAERERLDEFRQLRSDGVQSAPIEKRDSWDAEYLGEPPSASDIDAGPTIVGTDLDTELDETPLSPVPAPADAAALVLATEQTALKPFAAEPTFVLNLSEGTDVVHEPDSSVSAVVELTSRGRAVGNGQSASVAHTLFDAGHASPAPAINDSPLGAAPQSLVKDVLIGVLLAIVLILGVVLWRLYITIERRDMATVVVSVRPPQEAELFVDKQKVAVLLPGVPRSVEVVAGFHDLMVKGRHGSPANMRLHLKPAEIRLVPFELAVPRAFVALSPTPADARVYLNGAEVARESLKQPLNLRPGVEYRVRVAHPGYADQQFTLRLERGQSKTIAVTLKRLAMAVEIQSRPAGAQARIGDTLRGTTPLSLHDLLPGKHLLTLELEGYLPVELEIEASADRPRRYALRLRPRRSPLVPAARPSSPAPRPAKPAAVSQRPGFLVANTTPWARVLVDGKDIGRTTPITPKAKLALTPGRHQISFVVGGKRFDFPVLIRSDKTERLIKTLAARP
ncbi:MAG: serine/threonine protein kinase [Deltaproteobacteria bacterium]|nr:serine/threonine protein kinase [Deltaproteobacteria bacterium]